MTGRETIVLLPGMMCDWRLFKPQIEAFSADFDIFVGDLTAAPTIEGMARRLLDGLPERFNLLGLSMGGIVAMAMIGIAPERIARLGLLDTNYRADPPERRSIRDRQARDARAGRLSEVIRHEMMPGYFAACNRDKASLAAVVLDMALSLGPDAFVSQTAALRDRFDLAEAFCAWSGPALVMCGAEDRVCTPERHREIAALLGNEECVVVPDAAHLPTLENPQAVNAAIARWLARPAETKDQ